MQIKIEIILAAFLFAYYFVEVAAIPKAIKRAWGMIPAKRLKPFDCTTCLSVWTAAAFYFLPENIIHFIFVIFAAGFLGQKVK